MYSLNKRNSSLKLVFCLIAILVIISVVIVSIFVWTASSHKTIPRPPSKLDITRPKTPSISMLLTGDWIAHDSVNAAAKQPSGNYDYSPLIDVYAPLFKRTDVKFCNDPILNGGSALGISGYPKFNSPTEFVTNMGAFGCNLVNTASNHSFDFAQANIDASVDAWSKVPRMLAVAGENRNQIEHDTIHYFTTKGVRFAFLAYTTYSNSPPQNNYGVNVYSKDLAASQIQSAKAAGARFVIVSMRWGVEYSGAVSLSQQSIAQDLSNEGVNLILGHGPHILQPVEQLTGQAGNKTLVWYSLGNFLNTQEPPETLFNVVALLTIDPKTLTVAPTGFLPFYMHYEWTPEQAKADNTNARTAVKMYLLENTTQTLIDAQQLHTSVAEQKNRLTVTLQAKGIAVPLVTSQQLGL